MTDLDKYARARDELLDTLMPQHPEINGGGIGKGDDGELCVVIVLEKKPKGWTPPTEHNGIPVQWKIVGKIRAL